MSRWLRHIIVRAAPTCTLWGDYKVNQDFVRFRFWRHWTITGLEMMEVG